MLTLNLALPVMFAFQLDPSPNPSPNSSPNPNPEPHPNQVDEVKRGCPGVSTSLLPIAAVGLTVANFQLAFTGSRNPLWLLVRDLVQAGAAPSSITRTRTRTRTRTLPTDY